MALQDEIKIEIDAGRLQPQWTINDLLLNTALVENYKKSTLKTDPPNRSISSPGLNLGNGFNVKKGATPAYVRVGRSEGGFIYSLADQVDENHQADKLNYFTPPPADKVKNKETDQISHGNDAQKKAAKLFVEFLRESPFRVRMKNGRGFEWYPKEGPAVGWSARLEAYRWGQSDWISTKKELNKFINTLEALENDYKKDQKKSDVLIQRAISIYNEIANWGGTRRGKQEDNSQALDRLVDLWDGNIKQVDSTLTKLYALSRPDEFVIYDSRVAAAILRIAEYMYPVRYEGNCFVDSVEEFHKAFRNLGKFNAGRGGTRVKEIFRWSGWPGSYGMCNAQTDANRLCHLIVQELNQSKECKRENWTLREVEAVLFMEGY